VGDALKFAPADLGAEFVAGFVEGGPEASRAQLRDSADRLSRALQQAPAA
jgi:hypothetical protein